MAQMFTKGLSKLCSLASPGDSLHPQAKQALSAKLEMFSQKIVNEAIRTAEGRILTTMDIKRAMDAFLPGALLNNAVSESARVMALFEAGLIRFDPTKVTRVAKMSTPKPDLTRGVGKVCKLFPDTSLQLKSKQAMSSHLGDLALRMVDEVKRGAKDGTVTPADIKRAVEKTLPGNMQKHALAEGAKMVLFLESGYIAFQPRKKKVVAAKKKRRSTDSTPRRTPSKRRKVLKAGVPKKVSRKTPATTLKSPALAKRAKKSPVQAKRTRKSPARPTIAKKRKRSTDSTPRRSTSKTRKVLKAGVPKRVSRKTSATTRKSPALAKRAKKSPVQAKRTRKSSARPTKAKKSVEKTSSDTIHLKDLGSAIGKLNNLYGQTMSKGAEKKVGQVLVGLCNSLVDEISGGSAAHLGVADVRNAVVNVFPTELQQTALGHMEQAVMHSHWAQ